MRGTPNGKARLWILWALVAALLWGAPAAAEIPGLTGTSFTLVAGSGYIQNGDGNNLFFWGFADGNPASGSVRVQYPGPTLIVNQGAAVTVTLVNWLPEPVSLLFPGMENVSATPSGNGLRGIFTWDAPPGGGTVTYSFTASRPGTFYYQSGTNMDKQLEMGLFGAIIVRPAGFDAGIPANRTAYGDNTSAFDQEYLLLLSEMDDRYHNDVEEGLPIDTTTFFPTYWFINGRNAPDTMGPADASWLPAQPYNAMPMMYPGEKVLLRIIDMGRDQHPFHHHGNHSLVIAWDGLPLSSDPANLAAVGADLAEQAFSVTAVPGRTSDSIYTWTGKDLGWDVYGDPADPMTAHSCTPNAEGFDPTTFEWCADHGIPLPVLIPDPKEWAPGQFYSGSPFLGVKGALPPGAGNMNVDGSFFHMWHSHNEKEMTTNDVFPGGMMTMIMIMPRGMMMPIP
jgi:FtsP/CotA-like multicopper oxidase with cupredoxin domain